MSLLVVGSIAIDSVETPHGEAPEALGGAAVYFSYSAANFINVRLVGVIGEDFPTEHLAALTDHPNIDTGGIHKEMGKTFRWKGRYTGDMNVAETLEVHLNVLGDFDPVLPDHYRDSKYVFLANASPTLQRKVLSQVRRPKLAVADTMNLWIETQRSELLELLREVDGLVLNDREALLLSQHDQLVVAGMKILDMGPKFVIVKKGEHGALFFERSGITALPAYPTTKVVDPTGAGDSFAGGFMGHLASVDSLEPADIKRAMAHGTIMASINVEDFSLRRLQQTTRADIDKRYDLYRAMLKLD